MAKAADWFRRQLRRGLKASAVLGVILIVAIGAAVLVDGPPESYRGTLEDYLEAVATSDADTARANVCSSARARLAAESDWSRAIRSERERLGGTPEVNILRGERRLAYLDLTLQSGEEVWGYLKIADEHGRLLPCPTGDRLYGDRVRPGY